MRKSHGIATTAFVALMASNAHAFTLFAHWDFDEANPLEDRCGNVSDLYYPYGEPVLVDMGGGNMAVQFDGENDYLEGLYTPEEMQMYFSSYAVEVEFAYTSPTGRYLLNRSRSGSQYHQNFAIDVDNAVTGQAYGRHEKADDVEVYAYTNPTYPLNDGELHTLRLEYDETTRILSFYRDGVLDDSVTDADPSGYNVGVPWELVIGASGEKDEYFTGYVSDVKLYVPEPTTLSLFALSSLMLRRRRLSC